MTERRPRTLARDRRRWLVWLVVLPLAAWLVVPPARQLWRASRPAPTPSATWSAPATGVSAAAEPLPAPLRARRVYVPALGIDMPWHDAGEAEPGVMALDPDLGTAVRFTGAGDLTQGSLVMAAHLNDRTMTYGPFSRLGEATPGMLVVVTDAAGRPHRYAATALQTYRSTALPQDVWATAGPPSITLATCGGALERGPDGRRHYAHTVVVRGVPAD